jgi:hypothetical protein
MLGRRGVIFLFFVRVSIFILHSTVVIYLGLGDLMRVHGCIHSLFVTASARSKHLFMAHGPSWKRTESLDNKYMGHARPNGR